MMKVKKERLRSLDAERLGSCNGEKRPGRWEAIKVEVERVGRWEVGKLGRWEALKIEVGKVRR